MTNYIYNVNTGKLSATVSDSTLDKMNLTYSLVSDVPLTPDEVRKEIEKRKAPSYWMGQIGRRTA